MWYIEKKSTTHKMKMRMGIGRKKKIGFWYGEVTMLTILTKKNIFTIYKLYKSYVLNTKILIYSLQKAPFIFNHSTNNSEMIDIFVYLPLICSTFVVGIISTIYRN